MKLLIVGSNGLVGKSLQKVFSNNDKISKLTASTREDTNLFNFKETKKLIDENKPNILINAAARVGGIYANNTKRTDFILENLKINTNLLEASIPYKDMTIFNLGSSCIYPLNAENPIKEEYIMSGQLEPTNSPYAMAKLTAIELGKSLSKQYGHKVINLMPTNLYGPNDNFSEMDSHVIPALIHKMHFAKIENHEEFFIWGTGKPLREFLYVDDLALCIKKIVESEIKEDVLNVGSGEEISIYNLALLVKEVIGFKGDLKFDSEKPDGNPRKLLDSKLINKYGWYPQTSLEKGLKLTYDWYLENI